MTDSNGNTAHVVVGELLMRTAQYTAAKAALASKLAPGWTAEPNHVGGLITRIRLAKADWPKLSDMIAGGIADVFPNAVVPTGAGDPTVVWKRATPPTPAPVPGPAKPPATPGVVPAKVVIIDTGVPETGGLPPEGSPAGTPAPPPRTDGWLAGLVHKVTRDNIDLLDFFSPQGYLDLAAGHGAFVTGIVQQLAPDARIDVRQAVDSDGIGTDLRVADELHAALADYPDIMNLSVGAEAYADLAPPAMAAAVGAAPKSVLIVAAAGNSGQDRKVWPAALPGVISVGALTATKVPAKWSSFGGWVTCSTYGEDVLSTYVLGTQDVSIATKVKTFTQPWAQWTGTSFAAPQVTGGIAALMHEKGISAQAAFAALTGGAMPDPSYGFLLT